MNMCKKLRTLLKEKDYLFTPGIANPIQAMVVEKAGFALAYMGGYDTSATESGTSRCGLDHGDRNGGQCENIARAVNIPVLADADNGYGNAINVIRTVQNYEAAGVAGIHIEDQVSPKRCGHLAGR